MSRVEWRRELEVDASINSPPSASASVASLLAKIQSEQVSTTTDTYVALARRRAARAHVMETVHHLEVISAHTHGKISATPLRCTYLGRAHAGLRVNFFFACADISIHPLRDFHERGQSKKPTQGAINALRHNVLAVRRGDREMLPLTRHVVLLLLLLSLLST